MRDQESLKLLRCNIENILDWGIVTRKRRIEARYEEFFAYSVQLNAAEKRTAKNAAKDAIQSAMIKRQIMESAAYEEE